jgi:diketogulonate reductase-like aldo/keto reductase
MNQPKIIYGTAWKKERTTDLVKLALSKGFRGIDTACQPRHYREDLVGLGLKDFFESGNQRSDLFIQTKFSPIAAQDLDTIPYNPDASIPDQVHESLQVSLKNLGVSTIDSWLLHGPMPQFEETLEVLQTMVSLCDGGVVKQIGICNHYDVNVFKDILVEVPQIKVLQNRFYNKTGFDKELRQICLEKDISYQSFWTLTANPHILQSPVMESICQSKNKTEAQVWFHFLSQRGITPLSGTTHEGHMVEDLAIGDFELEASQMQELARFIDG